MDSPHSYGNSLDDRSGLVDQEYYVPTLFAVLSLKARNTLASITSKA